MRKALLGAAAAVAVAVVGFAGQAEAQQQCWWNGYSWACHSPAYHYNPGYYGYSSTNPYATGYKPDWLPSYPGPKPSGGAGR